MTELVREATENPRVIITRAKVQAENFLEKLCAAGICAEIFSLMEIHALTDNTLLDQVIARVSEFSMVAFVSPNAIEAFFSRRRFLQKDLQNDQENIGWPSQVSIAVMGEGSRAALLAIGISSVNARIFSPQNTVRTDSETLLESFDVQTLQGGKVLIIRGETGREFLADALRNAGAEVQQFAAYRRVVPVLDEEKKLRMQQFLSGKNDWIVSSSEVLKTMLLWAELSDAQYGLQQMQKQHIIVPHYRIAETAKTLGFQFITLTGSGDENLLVELQS